MFWEILTNVSSAADLLKRIRADPSPVKMAIGDTAQAFPDIEGIEQHLASLWDDKEMQKLLNESASSGVDIPIQVLTRRFVEPRYLGH